MAQFDDKNDAQVIFTNVPISISIKCASEKDRSHVIPDENSSNVTFVELCMLGSNSM